MISSLNIRGLYRFWKAKEMDNAILQDLESFGKREVFQNGYGEVLHFCLGKFLNTLKWI